METSHAEAVRDRTAPAQLIPSSGEAVDNGGTPSGGPVPPRRGHRFRMRKQDWAGFLSGSAAFWLLIALARRRFRAALVLFGVGTVADVLGRVWSRRDPTPLPAALRWILHTPHPRRPLQRALAPRAGERVLEIGPGLGQYAVDVARWVAPDGQVDVVDVQQEMLDATMRLAARNGVDNIVPSLCDAGGSLPFPDGTFDGAYLNSVLGEIPDQVGALSELRRLLKPGGRIVVGEIGSDPDFVSLRRLREAASAAGFRLDDYHGPRLAYFARLIVA